jgi:hypothetical protein|tara:strand:- start:151 stop:1002 length:852 start_codon:yes stop_codon:yes gene_type:complete
MKSMNTLVAILLLTTAQSSASEYELLFFTQNPEVCSPCIPVKKMVAQLLHEGRSVTTYNYQIDSRPFTHYWGDESMTPSFILLKNGKVFRRYVPDKKNGLIFTVEFLRGIAPPNGSKALDPVGNPFIKALKKVLPVPPPPGERLPVDVPDREKVKRIITLENMVRDLQLSVVVLREELRDAQAALEVPGEPGKSGRDGDPGKDGKDGRDGERGPQGVSSDGKIPTEWEKRLSDVENWVTVFKKTPLSFAFTDTKGRTGARDYLWPFDMRIKVIKEEELVPVAE